MRKALLILLTMLLTLPSFASAYNYWYVTKAASPSSLAVNVTPPSGAGYSVLGSKTNITDAGITTADFTIVAPAGYSISAVKIDNVVTAPVAADTYRVNKGSKTSHTIVAYYVAAKYLIDTTPATGGFISPDAQVGGGDVTIQIIPNAGYVINSVIVDGSAVDAATLAQVQTDQAYTFSSVSASHTLTATFAIVPKVTAVIGTPAQTQPVSATIDLDGTGSSSNVAATYAWTVLPAGPVITPSADGKSATFKAGAPGSYTVTLTLSAAGATGSTSSVAINILSDSAYATQACATCHDARNPGFVSRHVTAYDTSVHAAESVTCEGCHTPGSHFAPANCSACHQAITDDFASSLHGTRPGKGTFYNDGIGETELAPLQLGFGNFVDVDYAVLPCADCHNAAAWTVDGVDTWTEPTCNDCHGNRANDGSGSTTDASAPVAAATCYGCHSRQAYEGAAFGLTDVHILAGMTCSSCHSAGDMHGDGTAKASLLEPGAISARCENCHGDGTAQGSLDMNIPEHGQHLANVDCSACHMQSVVACYNCHFDNEGITDGSVTHQKFASAKFGGQGDKAWRFLVNRVMADGSTKVYPGSMQSLVADVTAKDDGLDDGQGVSFVAIASYYAHSITRVDALTCDKCHGIENAVRVSNGLPVDVVKWNGAEGEVVAFGPPMMAAWQGPKGVIPVPEDTSLLKFDFVDVTDPAAAWNPTAGNIVSPRILFKRGADVVHMPEAYVKPLTDAQLQALAAPYRAAVLTASAAHTGDYTLNNAALLESTGSCAGCHTGVDSLFSTAPHNNLEGKGTWYNDNIDNPNADGLQKGFGSYVTVDYNNLPCAKCHNAAAWTVGGTDTWPGSFGQHVCTDCHGNASAGVATTTFEAPVTKNTCLGCHSRQKTETAMGLTDVHATAGMGCTSCHTFSDLHGDGTDKASMLEDGAITAQCENCHGAGTSQGPISSIAAHLQHQDDIACSTCHMESVITCYNCHFDNEASDPADSTILHAKFASAKFGGTKASGKAWRFLVNRVMGDGTIKVYPASMQSLVADRTAANAPGEDDLGWTHAGIGPYYSHSITRVNALSCDECHGIQNAIDLANGVAIDVARWNAGVWTPPKGVIPVPENPVAFLNMDFVDLVDPAAALNPATGSSSSARKFFKAGVDSIHMPEAYVKPLTAEQIQKLADPQFDHTSGIATTSDPVAGFTENSCYGCHETTNATFATALHNTLPGKETWYNDNIENPTADGLQKGFGNYVTVDYTNLPCAKCHNAKAWTVDGVDTWPGSFGQHVCTDCHTNRAADGSGATTAFDAPITKATCLGCHSRQATEASMGLTDVHTGGEQSGLAFACTACHGISDLHGDGTAKESMLEAGAITAKCENCHTDMAASTTVEHTTHLANIACSTCHMESVITCYNCHFDNEASDPADATILHAKFASAKFGGTKASGKAWRFLVNRVMPDGSTKVYPASMQSLVADRTAANAPGEDDLGWTHAGIGPYYSHSITLVNALKCADCHNNANAQALLQGTPIDVVRWNAGVWTPPKGIIPVPENPAALLNMDFVDLVDPAAPLNPATGSSSSARKFFKAGVDSIHMPEAYVTPLTNAQLEDLAAPQ